MVQMSYFKREVNCQGSATCTVRQVHTLAQILLPGWGIFKLDRMGDEEFQQFVK